MTCGFFAKGLGGFIRSDKARRRLTGFSQNKAIQEVHVLVYTLNKREERMDGMRPNVFLLLCIAGEFSERQYKQSLNRLPKTIF